MELQAKNTSEQTSSGNTKETSISNPTVSGAGVVSGIRPIALVGHRYYCPVPGHESSVLVTGSSRCKVMGVPIVRIGDKTSCGATIITGSRCAYIDDNRPIARRGDKGIHPELGIEGEIVEGLDNWTLE